MKTDSALVGYLVGGLPVLIVGLGLLRGTEVLGLPPVVAGLGMLTAAIGVAETFEKIIRWVVRGGQAAADATKNPLEKKRRDQQWREWFMLLLVLSGPIYFYTLELQSIPQEQWLFHLVTLDPLVIVAYLVGGPFFTLGFVIMRLMVVDYCNERLPSLGLGRSE